jgi:cyclic pyranopterin phosphate synthase
MVLVDRCGRPLLNIRVAVTRRCNLHCEYCHMEGEEICEEKIAREMTADEIVRIMRIAAQIGISNVKLTGGEPLLREDILKIIRGIARLVGIDDLSMTTNGVLLSKLALRLRSAGLKRVNITVPTLDEKVYKRITGGNVADVLNGVEAAVHAGLHPVKINMLILRGINDRSVVEMINYAKKTGVILQLIELEKINITEAYYFAKHQSLAEYEAFLKERAIEVETREYMHNRRVYGLPGVRVEAVRPTENAEFCMHCTRLRLTSDGKLKPCLMTKSNLIDVITPVRNGASDMELAELFRVANERREPYNGQSGLLPTEANAVYDGA